MKKSILLFALLLSGALYQTAGAQANVRINIGNQPVWGPVGYDYVDYYYFPEADVYYNVSRGQYVYFDSRNWVYTFSLPGRYQFDPYRAYKVVVNDPDPFRRNDYYRRRYSNYRGRQQALICNSHDPCYFAIEQHPEHNRWLQNQRSYNDYRRNDNRNYGNNNNRDYAQKSPGKLQDYNRTYGQDRQRDNTNNRQYDGNNNDNRGYNNANNRQRHPRK